MHNFAFSFVIIIGSLAAGHVFNRMIAAAIVPLSAESAERLRRAMQKTALLAVNPVAFCGAIWIADLSAAGFYALPFIGLAALATGLALGAAGTRLLKLPPEQAGVYTTSASFTNIGNIGGLVAFVLLGEAGFALVPFYKLFEELWYYSLLFPIARSYGERANPAAAGDGAAPRGWAGLLRVVRDPFLLVAFFSISMGLILNVSGLQRPAFYAGLNAVLVPLSSFLLLFAIGMNLRFTIARRHLKAAALLIGGKALIVPAMAFCLALLLGLGQSGGGVGLKLVLVLAAMPIGFLGLVPPALYKLDQDFAGSLWLASNGALVAIVPILALLV
jgi:predicted permease